MICLICLLVSELFPDDMVVTLKKKKIIIEYAYFTLFNLSEIFVKKIFT